MSKQNWNATDYAEQSSAQFKWANEIICANLFSKGRIMKRLHLALGVGNIKDAINDYTNRFGQRPVVVIENEYALFRTETLNISIRKRPASEHGLRHLGWESDSYTMFDEETDCNGIVWEHFSKNDQIKEILDVWPDAKNENPYLA